MPQSSKYLLYAFLAVQLLLNVTLLNAAVIRRDKREITTNVTGIASSNNEVDSATVTTEEDVGTLLLGTQSSGSDGTTTGKPLTDGATTNLNEDKKEDTTLTGFAVDENTVGLGSNKLESPSYNVARDNLDPAKSVDDRTTVVSLSNGVKNDFHGESSTADETTTSQSTMNVTTDMENGPTLKEDILTTDNGSPQSTTQAAVTIPSTATSVINEDTTASITHPSVKINEAVSEQQVTVAKPSAKIEEEAVVEDFVTVTHPPVKIDEAKAFTEETVTDYKSIYPVTVANPSVKIDDVVSQKQVTSGVSISQVTVGSTTASPYTDKITTTDANTTIEGSTSPSLKSNVDESEVKSLAQMQTHTEESSEHAFPTTQTASSHDLTDETTLKLSTALFINNLSLTDATTPLTSTVKFDETTLILTSTEAADENPIQTTFHASAQHQDPLQSQAIKNSSPSSAEKRGKFIDDNYSSFNELRLPNTSDVWALAGLKSAGRIKSSELPNSLETSDEKAVNTSMVTKSLLDWSRVMSSEGMESETTVKITTTDSPTTTTTTKQVKTVHENEVEMLTTKSQPDVTTEVVNLTDRIENQETTSLRENEVDTKASLTLETTTSLEDESTHERMDDTSLSSTDDDIAATTKASLILLKGRDDAYIQDNQVEQDSVEEKPPSPTTTTTTTTATTTIATATETSTATATTTTTTTPIPDLVVTMKSETTNSPVNGETTEVENTSTFATSTLSAIDFTTSMPFLTSTTITTTTSMSTPSIAFNMDDRTNEPPNMASTPTPPPQSATTVVPSTTTTTTEIPAVTVMAATTESETQTTEAHTPAAIISSNDAMTQNANNYNNYEVVNKTTTQFADSSSIEASEASTRVAPIWSLSTAETTTTATEVDRVDVDFDVTTASIFDYSNAFEIVAPHPSTTTTVASTFTFADTSTAIPIITPSSSNNPSTIEDLGHIDSKQKIPDTGETSIESNVIDPLHARVASTTTTTTTTTATTKTTTTTENSQDNMRMQSTGSGEMDSTSTTTSVYDDSTTTLQSISTKKEDVYSIVPTIDSGFHVPKLVVDETTISSVLAAGTGGVGESMDPPDGQETDVNVIIAISVSAVGIVALILLVAFLYVMRKRQKQMSYGQRCRPVSLDAYSLDNVSVYNSVRRKGATLRASKRSYGNVAFDDPSLRHNVMGTHELAKYLEKKSSIWEEYRDVPQIIARADEVPAGCEDKNRYANVIPLPETRVILQQQNNDEKSEYINANYVRGPKDTTNYYIACQAPLDTTVTDFWRMIWEQNSRVIIMATDLIENGIDKCAEYLPPSVTLDNHTVFGDFQVTLKNREVKEKYAISTLMLRNNATEESREITHYWYQWPESGVPTDEAAVIAMLLEARSSLKAYTVEQGDNKADTIITDETKTEINGNVTSEKPKQPPKDQGPLTIHCSPGTGRTGTILACDIAMRCLEEPKRCVDIPQIVYSVRRGRASAVQTKEQYEFIYKVTHMYATKISNINNDN